MSFSCTNCGDCCTGFPGYVWVKEPEIRALAKHLGLSLDEFGRKYLRRVGPRYSLIERPNNDCVFWKKGGGCSVYPVRPVQCRTFPFWPEHLKSRAAWERACASCPGAGKGRFYPAEEIALLRRSESETGDGS